MTPSAGGRPGRLIGIALALALVVRFAFAFGYWRDKPLTNDEQEYLLLGQSLAAGQGYQYPDSADARTVGRFGRAPGYPAFLSLLVGGGPLPSSVPNAVKMAQCLLGGVGVLAIALLAWRISGPDAAVWGAFISAIYPPLVWLSGYALSESLYSPLIVGATALAVPLSDGPDRPGRTVGRALITGALLGLSALIRPSALAFLGLIAIWLVLNHPRLAAAFVLGAIVMIAPWTVRNTLRYGKVVLVASEGGVTFWTGNHRLSSGEGDMAANPDIKRAYLEILRQHPGATQEDLEPIFYREAFRTIEAEPLWWVSLLARKAFYLWVPVGRSYTLHSRLHYAVTLVGYLTLLPFAVAGMLLLARGPEQPWAMWLQLAAAVALSVLFICTERYRIPVIDPVLIVCASAWLGARVPLTKAR